MRIIWFGEEDQLRIMCMKKGSDLLDVFNNLNEMLKTVEGIDGIEFARDKNYGYVTSCPSNLGTGMRASVRNRNTSVCRINFVPVILILPICTGSCQDPQPHQ